MVLNGFGPAQEIEAIRTGLQDDHGIRAIYSDADMSKGAEILDMVRKAEQALGSVDILVNNAGIQFVAPVEEFPAA